MKYIDRIEINVKGPSVGQEMSCFLPWDADINQWRDVFKVILTHQTFHADLIAELFNEDDQ